MKHRVYGKHLGRNKDQRDTLFKSLVRSLILHGTIETSESKAKAVKGLVDKVINLAKEKHKAPRLQSFITNKNLQDRLIKEIVPKLGNRNSGYTSFIRLGRRLGDQTMMVRMSLIGAEELKPIEKGIGSRVQGIEKKTKEVKKEISKKKIATKKLVRKTTRKVKK